MRIPLAFPLALVVAASVQGREFAVSPGAAASGDGTPERPLPLETAVGPASPAKPGDTVILAGGRYTWGPAEGRPRPLQVSVSGTADQRLRVAAAPGAAVALDGCLTVGASHLDLVGLDIGHTAWNPTGGGNDQLAAVTVGAGRGVRLINCNLFGGYAGGLDAAVNAEELTVYGCLIHDFGTLETTRYPMDIGDIRMNQAGLGDGIKAQNRTGVKTFARNILYRGCGANVNTTGLSAGFDYIENISFLSKALKGNENMDSFLLAGNYSKETAPMDRIRVIGNLAYQPSNISAWRPNLRLYSYAPNLRGGTAEVRGNWLIGANHGMEFTAWNKVAVADNTIWAFDSLIRLPGKGTDAWTFSGNTYYANGREAPFSGGTFAAWQARGFDADGRLIPGTRPTGTKVFVFGNEHEKNRAQVAVFNFDGERTVRADLGNSVAAGTAVAVWNCLDIRGPLADASPVLRTVYGGGALELPLKNDPASPEFEVFLVRTAAPGP